MLTRSLLARTHLLITFILNIDYELGLPVLVVVKVFKVLDIWKGCPSFEVGA